MEGRSETYNASSSSPARATKVGRDVDARGDDSALSFVEEEGIWSSEEGGEEGGSGSYECTERRES